MMKKLLLVLSLLLLTARYSAAQTAMELFYDQIPIAVNKADNRVLRIKLTPHSAQTQTLRQVAIRLDTEAGLSDIASVKLYCTGKNADLSTTEQFGHTMKPSSKLVFKAERAINETTYFWLSIELKKRVNLLNKLTVECEKVVVDNINIANKHSKTISQRFGVAVRQHGDNGVDTYRIPGVTTTKNGTLLAVYDVRRERHRDLQGDIDIGISRSLDGGNTWQPMSIVLDMGEWGGLRQKFNGVSDATILVDDNTNDIYVVGLWMHGVLDQNGKWIEGLNDNSTEWNHQWRQGGTQAGFDVKQSSQMILTKSTDDGVTWSKPENITQMCKQPQWHLLAPAPGHGITLKDGTILFPSQGKDENGKAFSNITWSKDHGKTWTTSNAAHARTTENMAVELSDGGIMLNMRYGGNKGKEVGNGRIVAVTYDLGQTWTEHPTSRKALVEPTCMASIHRHDYTENGNKKSILLFVNPNSLSERRDITLKVSFDNGATWPKEYWKLLDAGKSRGYSCITSVNEQTVGILYESSQAQMMFQQMSLNEILNR